MDSPPTFRPFRHGVSPWPSVLTAVNYGILTGYDFLAFAYLGRHLPWRRVVLTSFLAYAISNNVGFAMLSGASVRFRFYTRWGITAEQLSRIVFSYVVTFWLGLLLIGGLSLAVGPLTRELGPSAPRGRRAPWLAADGASVGYVAAAVSDWARSDSGAWHFRFRRRACCSRSLASPFWTGCSPAPCCLSCCRQAVSRFSR